MGRPRLEHPEHSKQNTACSDSQGPTQGPAGDDSALAALIPGWYTLPEATRAAMLALIRNATTPTH
jgi:hypothetical protein